MTRERGTVYVVDDDEAIRRSVEALISTMDVEVFGFASAEEFLDDYDGRRPACVVTDVRMMGMSGLELQEKLNQLEIGIAVIVITAFASIPTAVRAMQSGAITILEKPCDEDALWNAIGKALGEDRIRHAEQAHRLEIRDRLDQLTPKERQVLDLIVQGVPNKNVANQLDVSVRTVESYRSRVFEKMQANSLAELVRMSMVVGDR